MDGISGHGGWTAMRVTVRSCDRVFLDYDEQSRRGKWIVHDTADTKFPVIRTDDYDGAMDAFTIRVELLKSKGAPEGYERVQVASRDGIKLIRTTGMGSEGLERVWMAIDPEGTRRLFTSCIEALVDILGKEAVDETMGADR